MTTRKNYNSIVFLTTLGVYLGLVLAGGAAPSVFAQAALTRDFDIKNEIVIEDDLDKKPDEDLFALTVVSLVDELNKLSEQKIFDWKAKTGYQVEDLVFSKIDNLPAFLGSGTVDGREFYDRLDRHIIRFARNIFTKAEKLGLGDFHSHSFEFALSSENGTLNLKTEIKSEGGKNLQPFADQLASYLTRLKSQAVPSKEKIVGENTKINFENNQIFVITRLPRASIDAILAEKNAR